MYMDKQVKRGYNEYIRLDEGIGKDAMMDVALLVMEDGDTWSCEEPHGRQEERHRDRAGRRRHRRGFRAA